MGDMFEKFASMVDVEGLKKDVESAAANTGDFVEVPDGNYEVKVTKLELGETGEKSKTPGMPMVKVWFDIVAGEFKGQKIFMNQMMTSGFGIHKLNTLLTALETGIPVVFENFAQYDALLKQIFAEVDGKAEYELAYGHNAKNFATYEIVQRFTN
jgi:hypothetical protein